MLFVSTCHSSATTTMSQFDMCTDTRSLTLVTLSSLYLCHSPEADLTAHLTGSSLHSINSSLGGDPITKTRETSMLKSLKPSMNIEHIENIWWSKIFWAVSTSRYKTFTHFLFGFQTQNRTTYINLNSFGFLPSTPYHFFIFYLFAFCP